jgi:hypothetical protein
MVGLLVMALLPIALIVGCDDHNPNPPGSGTKGGNGSGAGGSGGSTATPTTTPSIPMGLWVTANLQRSVIDSSLLGGGASTIVSTSVTLSINHSAESTDAITLMAPIEGAIPLPFTQTTTESGIPVAQYNSIVPYTYLPGGTYSIAVSTSLGAVTTSISLPGNITFSSTGASVTALYSGNFDSADVERYSPAPITMTYQSPVSVSVGSPFTFPMGAFSSPATFYSGYTATETEPFSSPATVGSSFSGSDSLNEYFAQ